MQLRWSVFTSKWKPKKTSRKAPYDWKPNKHGWFPTLFVGLCVSCNAVWRNGFAMSNVDISLSPQILPPQTQFQQTCGQVTPARAKPSLEYSYWPISCGVNANTPGGHLGSHFLKGVGKFPAILDAFQGTVPSWRRPFRATLIDLEMEPDYVTWDKYSILHQPCPRAGCEGVDICLEVND